MSSKKARAVGLASAPRRTPEAMMKANSISAIITADTAMAAMKRSGFCARAIAAPISSATSTMSSGRITISR